MNWNRPYPRFSFHIPCICLFSFVLWAVPVLSFLPTRWHCCYYYWPQLTPDTRQHTQAIPGQYFRLYLALKLKLDANYIVKKVLPAVKLQAGPDLIHEDDFYWVIEKRKALWDILFKLNFNDSVCRHSMSHCRSHNIYEIYLFGIQLF